jgi:alpha-galactosidase
MSITYYSDEKTFKLDTLSSSYIISLADDEQFVGHAYYGRRLPSYHVRHLLRLTENPLMPSVNNRDRGSFNDSFPFEYPQAGRGDYRNPALVIRTLLGTQTSEFFYSSHKIYDGKPSIPGLPAAFGEKSDCSTLELVMTDPVLSLELTLIYSVFEDSGCMTRSARLRNLSDKPVYIEKILSSCIDFEGMDYDLITLHGSWARERHINRRPLTKGVQCVSSTRSEPGHQEHPFMALVSKNCTPQSGEAYGFAFCYSGNFEAFAECNQFDNVRLGMGINHEMFTWKLEPSDSFSTPEVIMSYSCEGINGMTHGFHDVIRKHLIRGTYKDMSRPVLINNWEATYFDFTSDKLVAIAAQAAKLGIEMLVMDDGWFGSRSSDNMSLGDWKVNEEKLCGGLPALVKRVNDLGLKFGIWFEPEMISPDSDLYRAHPDWAIAVPGRTPVRSRNQYVLDISRKEIRDAVYAQMKEILSSANIEYVKWDMNRPLTDLYSSALPADRQGELAHRYMLGLYEMQERLITDFPDILLENCSGGGARFDAGMLYYSPQIWCSDDTDAIERLYIQEATAMVYPLSAIGAHVSDCPNHATGRNTPFSTRGNVALAGTFGYELDVTKIKEEERKLIPSQIDNYHKYNFLIRTGDYYRLASLSLNGIYDCYQVVSKDKSEVLVTYVEGLKKPNSRNIRIKLTGLESNADYLLEDTGEYFNGAVLMYAGIQVPGTWGDFSSIIMHFIKQ